MNPAEEMVQEAVERVPRWFPVVCIVAGVTCLLLVMAGCETPGMNDPSLIDAGADAAGNLGDAATGIGMTTGNPVLLGVGSVLTAVGSWLRWKQSKGSSNGTTPPAPPA